MKGNKICLLLVEDQEEDAAFFESYSASIESPKVEISHAYDLEEAIKQLKERSFDLIISDLDLPDAQGMEAIEALSEYAQEAPMLILTGAEEDTLIDKAAHLGVYDYLYKSELNSRYLKRSIRYALSRSKIEKRNQQLQDQLYHSQKIEAVGQLTGGIAHDFNNKLAVIQGYLQLFPRTIPESCDKAHKYLESIQGAVAHASHLTKQLLAFSRKQEVQKVVIDVNEVVGNSIKLLERVVGKVELNFEPHLEAHKIEVDPGHLDQIVMNLVINARDAINGPGKITVTTKNISIDEKSEMFLNQNLEPGEYVCLSVTDNGPGVPETIRNKIFEPFFTTKETGKGTGLGLSVVEGIVAQNLGVIKLATEVDTGTRFDIYFSKTDKTAPLATEVMPIHGNLIAQTILYAEDEPELRSLMVKILDEHGFYVIEAKNGMEAINHFNNAANKIDLVITDVVMPQMTGVELFEKLRERRSDLPFIFTSGYSKQEVTKEGCLPENTRFIDKPFSFNEVIADVSALLKQANNKKLLSGQVS